MTASLPPFSLPALPAAVCFLFLFECYLSVVFVRVVDGQQTNTAVASFAM